MSVAALYNSPTTEEEFHRWSFDHLAHHRDEVNQLGTDGAPGLPVYILDPINTDDTTTFLYQHQDMHNNTDALTGVGGYDLTSVDLSNSQQIAGWVYLNAQMHYNEATVLGVW